MRLRQEPNVIARDATSRLPYDVDSRPEALCISPIVREGIALSYTCHLANERLKMSSEVTYEVPRAD
jgi:hypothetical protein